MKRIMLASTVFVWIIASAGSPAVTAHRQQPNEPGKQTTARFYVLNRGKAEAVPISIQEMPSDVSPLRVTVAGTPTVLVAGTPTVAIAPGAVVSTRLAPTTWEYREVVFTPGEDRVGLLNQAGAVGWETTGLVLPTMDGRTSIVMKRAR